MTDIHTHLLHCIDDGADSIETSKKMLDKMRDIGITTVVCTPHFDYTNISPDEFFEVRDSRMAELSPCAAERGIKLVKGCELRLTPRVLNLESVSGFCIGDTRNVLIEMPFSKSWDKSCLEMLMNFIDYFNVCPIIAHVERYNAVIKNVKLADKLVDIGAVLQLDAASLFEKNYFKTARKLLKRELISIVASDCHNTTSRPPEILDAAYKGIVEICKNGAVEYLSDFADRIYVN